MPADTQVALLRVLQEREFKRVGGQQSIQVGVRVDKTKEVLEMKSKNIPAIPIIGLTHCDILPCFMARAALFDPGAALGLGAVDSSRDTEYV